MVMFMGSYSEGSYVFTAGKKSKEENMKYLSAVRKIEVGRNVKELASYCFCCFRDWRWSHWKKQTACLEMGL